MHHVPVSISLNGEDMSVELDRFATLIGLAEAVPNRYSVLLVLELFAGMQYGKLNPAKVVDEIRALEGLRDPSGTKPPLPFKHPPLKGLWHKHYLADGLAAVARNTRNGLQKYGIPLFEERVRKAMEAGEDRYLSPEDVGVIVDDAVRGNWGRRASANELTGEWIIYAQHDEANYYLCLGQHDSGDETLRAQIDAVCVAEFPFLAELLA